MKSHNQIMKTALLAIFWLSSTLVAAQGKHASFFSDADEFFRQYVAAGKIDYKAIDANPSKLKSLVSYLNRDGVKTVKNDEEKALLINAYNIFVIKGIIDNYPTTSPQEQSDFFKKKKYFLRGSEVSLEDIENDILRPITKDERLHFVLVCGALGCPKIAPYAYVPERLEAQLDERTEAALNDDYFLRVDNASKKLGLSQIFEWYKGDFVKDGQTINSFINKYRNQDVPSSYKKSIYTYDWTLNDLHLATSNGSSSSDPNESNLTKFTPSKLFGKGQFEVQIFNSLFSQISTRNKEGVVSRRVEFGREIRTNIFTSRIGTTFGINNAKTINAGVDLIVSSGSNGSLEGSSTLQFLGGDSLQQATRRTALTGVNLRLKFAPVKKWSFYSVQLGLLLPVGNNLEGLDGIVDGDASQASFLALNRYVFNSQFFYDIKLTSKFRLFYEFSTQFLPKRNDEVFKSSNFIDLPSTLIVNYFPTNKISLFVLGQYFARYGNTALNQEGIDDRFGLLQRTVQVGAGAKYQLTDQLGFELSYGDFIGGRGFTRIDATTGSLFNFGIRFINR